MVQYPGTPPTDPVVASALKQAAQEPLRLDLTPLRGTYQSRHHGGRAVTVTRVKGHNFLALAFRTPVIWNMDGAPDAYAPPTSATDPTPQNGLRARSHIGNATNTRNPTFDPNGNNSWRWTGVKFGKKGTPRVDDRKFLKDENGNFPKKNPAGSIHPNHYAPRTAMNMADGTAVNASLVAYGVLSAAMRENGRLRLGDFGLAIRPSTGVFRTFIYADAGGGNSNSVGEYSWRLVNDLFGAQATEDVCIIAFPGTAQSSVARPELGNRIVAVELSHLRPHANRDELARALAPTGAGPTDPELIKIKDAISRAARQEVWQGTQPTTRDIIQELQQPAGRGHPHVPR